MSKIAGRGSTAVPRSAPTTRRASMPVRGPTRLPSGEQAGTENVSLALSLSPLDPFRYAMLATRALDYLLQGDTEQAAVWADKAARSPGAHVLIVLIAVIAHALNNNRHRAAAWCAEVRARRTDLTQAHFFSSFPFSDGTLRRCMSKALSEYGF